MRYDTHTLVHLCSSAEWTRARAAGEYRPASLDEIGFVHLSAPAQAHLPANRLFAGREDLVVLHIDTRRVTAPIRWEPGRGHRGTPAATRCGRDIRSARRRGLGWWV
ncbi:glutathione S-transferase domain-containing protein [Mycobacteroides abscessus subsp. abscessus]|nr:glutathione S-transferase domain-containing protein [Mycobacteroides abscessus subsp. abscessus]